MRRSKELIGLPVLTLGDGRRLYGIKDVLFDPSENRLLALLLDEGGAFDAAKVIPFENIKSLGRDAIIVQDEHAIVPASSDERVKQAKERGKILSGINVYTEDGRYLGKIEDMQIDEQTGKIVGYDLSGGFLATAMRGRHFLSAPETMVMGRDVMFVPSETGTRMEEEVTGGLQATYEETCKRGGEVARLATEEFQRARVQAIKATAARQKDFVVGKVAEQTVTAPDGTVIVAAGDTVTMEIAERAESHGVLPQLVSTVGAVQVKGTAGKLGEEAKGAFAQLREAFGGVSKAGAERVEENKIKAALGRPVTRVILDENDMVILNTGDIITHIAIDRAREANTLDILLESVSKEEPKFRTEERRAPTSGDAYEQSESDIHQ